MVLNLVLQESKQYSLMKIITRLLLEIMSGRIVWKMEYGPTALMISGRDSGTVIRNWHLT